MAETASKLVMVMDEGMEAPTSIAKERADAVELETRLFSWVRTNREFLRCMMPGGQGWLTLSLEYSLKRYKMIKKWLIY